MITLVHLLNRNKVSIMLQLLQIFIAKNLWIIKQKEII